MKNCPVCHADYSSNECPECGWPRTAIHNDFGRMQSTFHHGKLIIEIPASLMTFAQRERPDFPLAIHDEEKMGEWVAKYLLHFGGDSEQGVTEFELFLDKMFINAYEDGEMWLDPINIDREAFYTVCSRRST